MDDLTRKTKIADQKAEAIRETAKVALKILANADDRLSWSERHALVARLEFIVTNAAHIRNELYSYVEPQFACVACGAPYTGPAVYTAVCTKCDGHEFKRTGATA